MNTIFFLINESVTYLFLSQQKKIMQFKHFKLRKNNNLTILVLFCYHPKNIIRHKILRYILNY